MQQQNNYNNSGSPVNNMGDGANITVNMTSENISEIVEALRVNGEESRAKELESVKESD